MRVVFMGTPAFAVSSLRKLAAAHEIALVLTRPDAVRSRGKKLEPSPVKEAALELDLPVMEANRMTPEVLDALRAAEAEIFCVAAYGCILPDEVATMAPLGCVNVHASLLPRWRGAAPIQRSILEGDAETGVSIMRIGHGVDTGAYCAQASCPVPGKSADELTAELAELGGDLLVSSAVCHRGRFGRLDRAGRVTRDACRQDRQGGAAPRSGRRGPGEHPPRHGLLQRGARALRDRRQARARDARCSR